MKSYNILSDNCAFEISDDESEKKYKMKDKR